jgi:two-component system sensor histidine kinase AlgZ
VTIKTLTSLRHNAQTPTDDDQRDGHSANDLAQVSNRAPDHSAERADFFLPNFCAIQPVLLLVIFSQLLAITFVLVGEPLLPFPWETLALISVFILWVTLTTASLWCILREKMMRWPEQRAASLCYIILVLVTLFFSLFSQWLTPLHHFSLNQFSPYWPDICRHVLIAAIIGGLILRYFYLTGQLEKQRRSELIHRIQALQSRIHPHFLFNSMNIIASLIDVDPEAAETVVEDLSEVFRASLNEVQDQVPLSQEIDLCKRYLNIEQLRLGARLQVIWDIPAEISAQIMIPMLTIQPILENAIYHGIQHIPEGGAITLSIRLDGPHITVTVRNPTPKYPPTKDRGNRLAVKNIEYRLNALYGPSASLRQYLEASWYCVEISYTHNSSSDR